MCGPRSQPLSSRAGTRGSPGLQSVTCTALPMGVNSSHGLIYTVLSQMQGWTRDWPKEEQPGKEAWQLPITSVHWAGPGGSVLLSARDRGLGCWGSTLDHSQPRCHGDGGQWGSRGCQTVSLPSRFTAPRWMVRPLAPCPGPAVAPSPLPLALPPPPPSSAWLPWAVAPPQRSEDSGRAVCVAGW